jgi:hypothetical protein
MASLWVKTPIGHLPSRTTRPRTFASSRRSTAVRRPCRQSLVEPRHLDTRCPKQVLGRKDAAEHALLVDDGDRGDAVVVERALHFDQRSVERHGDETAGHEVTNGYGPTAVHETSCQVDSMLASCLSSNERATHPELRPIVSRQFLNR